MDGERLVTLELTMATRSAKCRDLSTLHPDLPGAKVGGSTPHLEVGEVKIRKFCNLSRIT